MNLNDKVNPSRLCNTEIESQRKKNYQKKKKNVTKNDFQNVFYTILMSLMMESYRVCYMDDSETQFIQLIKHSHLHFRS